MLFVVKGAFIIYVTQGPGEIFRPKKLQDPPPAGSGATDVSPLNSLAKISVCMHHHILETQFYGTPCMTHS